MVFKEMDPEEVKKALEGHVDVVSPAKKEIDELFASLSCPNCKGSVMPFVDPSRLFAENSILPNYLARCKSCGTEFHPRSGLVVTGPRPSKVTF